MSNKRVRIKCKKLTSELSWKLWTDLTHICLFDSRLLAGTRHPRSKLVWADALRIHDATISEAFLISHLFLYFRHWGSKGRPAVWNPQIPTHGVATTDTAQRVSRQPGGELKGTGGVPFRASTGAWVCACVQAPCVFVAFLKWHQE